MIANLGRVRPNYTGNYDRAKAYSHFDAVFYNSSTYLCTNKTGSPTGELPITDKWTQITAQNSELTAVNDLGTITAPSATIKVSDGKIVKAEIGAAVTLALELPVGDKGAVLFMHIINGGAFTITWPANMVWVGGTAPTLNAAGDDLIYIQTDDSGATWTATALSGGSGGQSAPEEDLTDIWDGHVGTLPLLEKGVYGIYNAGQLVALATAICGGTHVTEGNTYKLMTDIDLNNIEWTLQFAMGGILDGNGHKIINFSQTENTNNNKGFMSSVTGCVKNLTFRGKIACTVGGTYYYHGFLAQSNDGIIENCVIYTSVAIIKNGWSQYAGGVVNRNGGTIKNCYVTGSVNAEGAGGIAFQCGRTSKDIGYVDNCVFQGTVTGNVNSRGIVSTWTNTDTNIVVRNCILIGSASSSVPVSAGTVTNCFIVGTQTQTGVTTIAQANIATTPVVALIPKKSKITDTLQISAYPFQSTQADTITLTAEKGNSVLPATIANDTATKIKASAVPATIIATVGTVTPYNGNARVTIEVTANA